MQSEAVEKAPATNADAQVMIDSILSESEGRSVTVTHEDYSVRIPNFEGPLDLLLHLIRKEQLDINDIPISHICKRYLDHLEVLREFNMDLAGEFMVMAATLMYLKSQVLIPKEPTEEEEDEDPRRPLVAQLLEYERFKKAADDINNIPWLFRDLYPRPLMAMKDFVPKHTPEEAPVEAIDTYQMLVCLKAATDRTERPPVQIHSQSASLKESVQVMQRELETSETVELRQLVPVMAEDSRHRLIVSFLAILELARLKFVEIIQTQTFGPIQVKPVKPLSELDTGLLDQF